MGIDKRITREIQTQWPILTPSAAKGALREHCVAQIADPAGKDREWVNKTDPCIDAIFGPPDTSQSSVAHQGALQVGGGHILAFPVASRRGVFAWVTCPMVFDKLRTQLSPFDTPSGEKKCPVPLVRNFSSVGKNHFFCMDGASILSNTKDLGGAEIGRFQFERSPMAKIGFDSVFNWFEANVVHPFADRKAFENRLALVSDDHFTNFVKHYVEVTTHNKLNYATKTVEDGKLFTYEWLPAETIIYTTLTCDVLRSPADVENRGQKDSRSSKCNLLTNGRSVLESVQKWIDSASCVMQVGASESKNHGKFLVKWQELTKLEPTSKNDKSDKSTTTGPRVESQTKTTSINPAMSQVKKQSGPKHNRQL